MPSHERLEDKARYWDAVIHRTADKELALLDSSVRRAIQYRVDVSGVASREQITRVGFRFYQDLEKSLKQASVQDTIIEDQLEDVSKGIVSTDSLLSKAVLTTGQFLLKIQSEPELLDMHQGFKRTYVTGRVRNITQILASPQAVRQEVDPAA